MSRVAVTVVVASLLYAGCTSGPSEREQGRALLEQLQRLEPSSPTALRAKELDELDALPLSEPELREVRAVCSGVHRSLLQAEVKQASARQALEAAQREQRDGGIAPEQALRIATAIRESDAELHSASVALPECQSRLRELTVRYR